MSVEFELPLLRAGVHEAGADLSSDQFKAVKYDASGNIVLAGAGERSVGILQNAPINGEAAEIEESGYSKAVLGAVVTAGQELAANAAGLLVPAAVGNAVVAVAKHGGAANQIVGVRVIGQAGRVLA